MTKQIDDILSDDDSAFAREVTVRIPRVRQALLEEHRELDDRLKSWPEPDDIDGDPERLAVAERVAEIEAEMDASVVVFRFQCIGFRAWADLLRAHPPTRDQKLADPNANANPTTFPLAAIAASCVEPEMTEEQARELSSRRWMDTARWNRLEAACSQANFGADNVPKSAAAGRILHPSGGSEGQPITTGSLEASSSDE